MGSNKKNMCSSSLILSEGELYLALDNKIQKETTSRVIDSEHPQFTEAKRQQRRGQNHLCESPLCESSTRILAKVQERLEHENQLRIEAKVAATECKTQ